jgi:hypothetical protein
MTKEEQVAFFAQYSSSMDELRSAAAAILAYMSQPGITAVIPLRELQAFQATLQSIVGMPGFYTGLFQPPIDRLRVPLAELKEFEAVLDRLTGGRFPQLAYPKPPIQALQNLPLELMQLSEQLSQINWQLERARKLKDGL